MEILYLRKCKYCKCIFNELPWSEIHHIKKSYLRSLCGPFLVTNSTCSMKLTIFQLLTLQISLAHFKTIYK